MWAKLWASFKRALSLDTWVQVLVVGGASVIVSALVGGFSKFAVGYVIALGVGLFLLGMAPLLALARSGRYELVAPAKHHEPDDDGWAKQEPPSVDEPTDEWVVFFFDDWGWKDTGLTLRLENSEGMRLRRFGCDLIFPGRQVFRADMTAALEKSGGNDVQRDQLDVFYPLHFPGAPLPPLDDGTYRVRWFVHQGAGLRVLVDAAFELRGGKVVVEDA